MFENKLMKVFEFSTEVITKIVSELSDAQEFIKIAIFQLHDEQIFTVLNKKLQEGLHIEIFTLPYDSIYDDVRDEVTSRFESLKAHGAILHFCKWNVGDPFRTTTAVGRWYSFHGKFIVTDKSAIALSANFTQSQELDALLILKNEKSAIEEYNNKYGELIDFFITDNDGYDGSIRRKIIKSGLPNTSHLFALPQCIQTDTHEKHWIHHYPSNLCPINTAITDRLYIAPFDCRARDFFMSLTQQARKFAYISTESFTDMEFSKFLMKMRLRGLNIKILSGATSMDFQDRMQRMLRELLAYGIDIRTTESDIHAKLIITDKHLVVSSVNLNKMNLGFHKTRKCWRANTETIAVCSDIDIIENAKTQYLEIYNSSSDIKNTLAEKNKALIQDILTSKFGLKSDREVKSLFARLVVNAEIEAKKFAINLGKITAKLMSILRKTIVHKDDFLSALILYYLSERKHSYDDLQEKITLLNAQVNLNDLLSRLSENDLIEKVEDFYKIKIDTLLKD